MNKGFIAIFMVTFLGFLGAVFIMLSATRVWSQTKNILIYEKVNDLKYDALSCIAIARLNLMLLGHIPVSEYHTANGSCEIKSVDLRNDIVKIITQSFSQEAGVTYISEIDRDTFEIVSLTEIPR